MLTLSLLAGCGKETGPVQEKPFGTGEEKLLDLAAVTGTWQYAMIDETPFEEYCTAQGTAAEAAQTVWNVSSEGVISEMPPAGRNSESKRQRTASPL